MKWILFMTLLPAYINSFSQDNPSSFKYLRYDEDYSAFKSDTAQNWYSKMKYASLSKNKSVYISFGGDMRFQYFYTTNENWGDAPKDDDGYVLSRYLFHGDLHAGKHFRTFVQLQSGLSGSRIDPGPVDDNPLELHQVFVDINTNSHVNTGMIFRLGRQEFLYGSQRLIAVREGPNNRQSFDAARLLLTRPYYKVDLFYGQYVVAKKKIFDDGLNNDVKLWGAYIAWNNLPLIKNTDLYYLGLWKHQAVFDDGQGKEIRHSLGGRMWKNVGDWNYDFEALYQFGKLAKKNIKAWTVSLNTSYAFSKARFRPRIGLKTELISGDKKFDDSTLQTFNPLFPRGAYFGLAALIGPANLIDVHPSLMLSLSEKIKLSIDYDVFWRYSRNDGLYSVAGSLTYSGKNIIRKFIGRQAAFDVSFAANSFLNFTTEFTWFDAGSYLKAAGRGKDILFTGITSQLKF